MEKIVVQNLFKIFGDHPEKALKMLEQGAGKDEIMEKLGNPVGVADVSFDVKEGEIVVVMGLSGSGKSTLVRCINRLFEPTAGKIMVDGTDVIGLDQDELMRFRRAKFGMVFQNFALFPTAGW
jgi:glycine betaine/proline transport system ATP-binding protein